MIRSFRHRGLARLWNDGDARGVSSELVDRIRRRLTALDAATVLRELDVPGWRVHRLRGEPHRYALAVSGPWRITFEMEGRRRVAARSRAVPLRRRKVSEHPARRPPAMEPTHPGAILREEVLPALGITVTAAAQKLRVSRQSLHAILAERSAVSPEMAIRLGRFCGNSPEIWLRMQAAHDLWHAERKLRSEVEKIPVSSERS